MKTDWQAIEAIFNSASLVIDNQSGHLFRRVEDGLWICSCGVYLKKVTHDLGFMRRYSTDGRTWNKDNPPCTREVDLDISDTELAGERGYDGDV